MQGQVLVSLFLNTRQIGAIKLDADGNAVDFNALSLPGGNDFAFSAAGTNPRGNPLDVTVDPVSGNIYVASFLGESGNGQIVRLTPTAEVVVNPMAGITFNPAQAGGNIDSAGVWIGGIEPGAGDDAIVNSDAILVLGNNTGAWSNADSYTYGGGATIRVASSAAAASALTSTNLAGTNGAGDYAHQNVGVSTFNVATLLVNDDIFANDSMLVFNAGSRTFAGDDFEANGGGASASLITINGGTHVVGDSFGVQNDSSVETLGGSVTASRFRLDMEGIWNVGGDALVRSMTGFAGPDGDGFAGTVNIDGDWTGEFTIDTFSASDWQALLTADDSTWLIDNVQVTPASFATDFVILGGGTTLGLVSANGLECDFDGNGQCDLVDIEILVDDVVDDQATTGDIDDWLAQASDLSNPYLGGAATFVLGDADLDGDVDSTDMELLLNNFGSTTALHWIGWMVTSPTTLSSGSARTSSIHPTSSCCWRISVSALWLNRPLQCRISSC